jgi:hypothetical protein
MNEDYVRIYLVRSRALEVILEEEREQDREAIKCTNLRGLGLLRPPIE